jgi:hypothetical protein
MTGVSKDARLVMIVKIANENIAISKKDKT